MNRRSLKTRSEITRVFLELLSTKPLKSITVKEVADGADVTRATFYSHYSDIYDLLNQTRADAIAHITEILSKSIPKGDFLFFTTELFSYFDKNEKLFAIVMGENGDISFLVSALDQIRKQKDELVKSLDLTPIPGKSHELEDEYLFFFLSGGILNMLTDWVSRENRLPVDEIAGIAARFIENTCSDVQRGQSPMHVSP